MRIFRQAASVLLLGCMPLAAAEFAPRVEPESVIPYLTHKVVVPPSPLKTQVLFIGGVDEVQTTAVYGNPAGKEKAKQWHDFIGFTPADATKGETGLGWITVNHEAIEKHDKIGDGGGMTAFKIDRAQDGTIQVVSQTLPDGRSGKFFNIDFVNTVGETVANCGGIATADGRIWSAEEWMRSGNNDGSADDLWQNGAGLRDTADFTIGVSAPAGFPGFEGTKIKKYQNNNWMVEVDPRTAKAVRKQYNWGRQGFEGGALMSDNKTFYLAEDGSAGASLFTKFVADVPGDFTKGKTYIYKQDPGQYSGTWVEIDNTDMDNMLAMHTFAAANSCTGFTRLEWVAVDKNTGKVYITETGTDKPAGAIRSAITKGFTIPKHYYDRSSFAGGQPDEDAYWDYYGRVLEFDPATNEMKTFLEGGPYVNEAAPYAPYPSKHLSNPDGLTFIYVHGKSYMVVQEDLNGVSFGRVPAGMSNRSCEMYLHDMSKEAVVENLVRIAITPYGAEVTGACATPDGKTILFNSQHPSGFNEYPYNNSLTVAVSGWDEAIAAGLIDNDGGIGGGNEKSFRIYPNPATREVHLDKSGDIGVYDMNGKRLSVLRGVSTIDIRDYAPGTYYLQNEEGKFAKMMIER